MTSFQKIIEVPDFYDSQSSRAIINGDSFLGTFLGSRTDVRWWFLTGHAGGAAEHRAHIPLAFGSPYVGRYSCGWGYVQFFGNGG